MHGGTCVNLKNRRIVDKYNKRYCTNVTGISKINITITDMLEDMVNYANLRLVYDAAHLRFRLHDQGRGLIKTGIANSTMTEGTRKNMEERGWTGNC